MSDVTRRLPVYLVLDCSGSMAGEPIEAVRTGIKALLDDLRNDPTAMETAYLSVITFSSSAQQVSPLTELPLFNEPNLDASGSTAFGEALRLLEQTIDREVRKGSDQQKGDWKPLVFIMTDGQPTDSWETAADSVSNRRLGNIIACAAGPNADSGMLKRVTPIVVELNNLMPDTLKAFFKWVSSSIKTVSAPLDKIVNDAPITLPPPPPQIQIVP